MAKAGVAAKLLSEPIDSEDLLYDLAQVIHQALSDELIRKSKFAKDTKLLPKLDALLSVPSQKVQEKVIIAILKASLESENCKELVELGTVKKVLEVMKVGSDELMKRVTFALIVSVLMPLKTLLIITLSIEIVY